MGQAESTEAPSGSTQAEELLIKSLPSALVIVGPSGVGKGTLINKLMEEAGGAYGFSCSHTTRKPREGEVDGAHYHFTTKEAFEAEIAEGKFLEYAYVHNNIYGTSIQAVRDVAEAGKCCILDIDVQGARQVRMTDLRAIFVFISPPSMEELEKRLRGRATDSEEQIATRLGNAREELASVDEPGLYDYILVNSGLEECYRELKGVALRALAGEVGGPLTTAAAAAAAVEEAAEEGAIAEEAVEAAAEVEGAPPTHPSWLASLGNVGKGGLERWQGKVALVTGAGSGVGWALATRLVAAGLRVVAVSRQKARLEALQSELAAAGVPLGETFLPVVADITKEAEVVALPRIVAKRWPGAGVDVLINNAAANPANGGLLSGATSAWVEMVSTNVLGAALAAREVVANMKERQAFGDIINIGCAAEAAAGSSTFFAVTKQALRGLSEGLRAEAAAAGLPVRVSLVTPGPVAAEGSSGQIVADDVVAAVLCVLSAPSHVDVRELVVASLPQ